MKKQNLQTLKGFRDYLPEQAKKRQYVINTLKQVFELYGFEPLETPALEYEEILVGKYGEEGDKLMYRFTDKGGRKVALRYDQTVPLARVVAQYGEQLPRPFKRYQIQPVWRAENPQKGRFREFLQCDIDTVGEESIFADSEIIFIAAKSLDMLGFKNFKILLNDRQLFSKLNEEGFVDDKQFLIVLRSLDKIKKIGEDGVITDLEKSGFSNDVAKAIIKNAKEMKENDRILMTIKLLTKLGVERNRINFTPYLARGLDYYTSMIFEIEVDGYDTGSVCGGGRYDDLIGIFTNKKNPAVGVSFGFDRLIEAMEEQNLFPPKLSESISKVLVTIFNSSMLIKSLELTSSLRKNRINTEVYLEPDAKIEKQLKYADRKNIPYVVIAGPTEIKKNKVILRNMKTREQEEISEEDLLKVLK